MKHSWIKSTILTTPFLILTLLGKWSFKKYGSRKILVEFPWLSQSCFFFLAVLYISQSRFFCEAVLEAELCRGSTCFVVPALYGCAVRVYNVQCSCVLVVCFGEYRQLLMNGHLIKGTPL